MTEVGNFDIDHRPTHSLQPTSGTRCKHMLAVRASGSTRCQQLALRAASGVRGQPGQRRPLHAQQKRAQKQRAFQQAARAGLACFRRIGDGSSSEMCRRPAGVSEQRRLTGNSSCYFVDMAAGEEERKKNMDLGFHGFYHGGPYGSISFHLGRKTLMFYI